MLPPSIDQHFLTRFTEVSKFGSKLAKVSQLAAQKPCNINRVSSHFRKWNSMIFPWIFHDNCYIFQDLYGMKIINCVHSARKNFKSSMQENLEKLNSMIFPWCILKFHDFSMILAFFSNSMIFPGLENDFAIFQNSMIFPWRWKPCQMLHNLEVSFSIGYLKSDWDLHQVHCQWSIKLNYNFYNFIMNHSCRSTFCKKLEENISNCQQGKHWGAGPIHCIEISFGRLKLIVCFVSQKIPVCMRKREKQNID